MPCCARRVVSVAPIIAKVNPEEMPRNSAASGAGSRYERRPPGVPSRRSLFAPVVIVDRQGRVIRKSPLLEDRDAMRGFCKFRGRNLIIDAPTDVLGPGLPAVGPPGVLLGAQVDDAEYVHP